MVALHALDGACPGQVNHFGRAWPDGDEVSRVIDALAPLILGIREHGAERRQVSMHVSEDGNPHGAPRQLGQSINA
jgi:hypothetical protein